MGENRWADRIEFNPPSNVKEARIRKVDLGTDIANIQSQLADRNRLIDGRRMTDHEYWTWRKNAQTALLAKCEELRRLKRYLEGEEGARRESKDGFRCLLYRSLRAILIRMGGEEALSQELDDAVKAIDAEE